MQNIDKMTLIYSCCKFSRRKLRNICYLFLPRVEIFFPLLTIKLQEINICLLAIFSNPSIKKKHKDYFIRIEFEIKRSHWSLCDNGKLCAKIEWCSNVC